jgi:hypothetical protein
VPEQLVVAHGSDGSIGAVRLSTEASGSLIGAASTSSGNAATNLIHHAHILVPAPPRNLTGNVSRLPPVSFYR